MRSVVAVLAALVTLSGCATAWAETSDPARVLYRTPVDAPVVDLFRPPDEPWGQGNRGVEYATDEGGEVVAAAPGVVAFAGQVGGRLHVVVLHADGVRTTYAFLRSVGVRRGQRVRQGQRVGTSGENLHFGARIGDVYVDPLLLLGGGPPEVHLVPVDEHGVGSENEEREGLVDQLVNLGGLATTWAIDWAAGKIEERIGEARGVMHLAHEANPLVHMGRVGSAALDWLSDRERCTPSDTSQPRLEERRMAVLVGGLGSTSQSAAIDDLDTSALGYAAEDVSRFSYRGSSVDVMPYAPEDTAGDLRHSGRLLREHLQVLAAENPGVAIDVIGHSQGGLVAREALTAERDGANPTMPQVSSLVTLGSPHLGADLATLAAMVGATRTGKLAHRILGSASSWDTRAPAVRQISEGSTFIRDLDARPVPEGVDATSIGARGDLLVPSGRTALDGAENVTVSVPGVLSDHDELPGSEQAEREVALAIHGRAPTCQGFLDAVTDAVVSEQIGIAEDAAGAAAWLAARRADRAVPSPLDLWRSRRPS